MKILFLGVEADRPFLSNLKGVAQSFSLHQHDFIEEIVLQYGKTGTTHIITTQQSLIPLLCDTASQKEQTLDNYAGSWVTHAASGMHFLFVHPLKQCITVKYGKFLLDRFVSKFTKPQKWVTQDTFSFTVMETPADYADALNNIENCEVCAVDIETRHDLSISCVSYTCVFNERKGSYTTETFVMPLPMNLEVDDYHIRYMWLARFNATPTSKILQNGKYDAAYLQRYNCPIAGYLWDTQLCHHAWYAELPKALDTLATFYIRKSVFWKHEGDSGNLYDLYRYNAMDTWHTAWVFLQWIAEAPEWAKQNYLLSYQTLAPNFLMESTGLLVDPIAFEEVKNEHTKKKEDALADLQACLGNPNYNPGSPTQNLTLLKILGCKEIKNADSKVMDRVAHQHPFIALLVEKIKQYSKAAKLVGTYLNEEKHFAGRMLYSLSTTTDTSRNKSKSHHFWCGCMPVNEAEAYTPEGWVKIADKPPVIAQWNKDGTLEFVEASWNCYEVTNEELVTYDSRCIKGSFTKDHRLPIVKKGRPLMIDTWGNRTTKSLGYSPLSGILAGSIGAVDELWLARCIMASADGCLEHDSWRFFFSKQRKIDYFKQLCPDFVAQANGKFAIKDEGYFKVFPEWFLQLPYTSRLVILEELKYWDAHIIGDSYRYYTTIKSNADLVHTLAHITGMSASIWVNEDNNRGYGSGNNKPLYTVNVSPKVAGAIEAKRISKTTYSGVVGCPTVPSSFWLVKYNGGIHVTGNSNIQNIPRTGGIKRFIIADEDFLLGEADYEQAESRDTGFISGDTVLIDAVSNPDIDFHRSNASKFFGVPYEQVDKELRQLGKPVNHGANYMMAEDTLIDSMTLANVFLAQRRLELPKFWTPKQVCKHLLGLFADTYKIVAHNYPQWIREQVKLKRMLVNPYGWTRYCFGDPIKNKSDLRALVAHLPQSTNAQALNLAMRLIFDRIWKQQYTNFKMNAQIHDSLLFQYREGHEYLADQVAECMVEASTVDVTDIAGKTRQLIVPVDVKIGGKSWHDSKEYHH